MTATQEFAEALHRLESTGDLEAFLDVFADDAVLVRPEPGGVEHGREGAQRFWQAYLDQFSQVASEFARVVQDGSLGELEWVAEGALASGRPITYAGVSLLELDDAGRVTRFATYYDTSAFVRPA